MTFAEKLLILRKNKGYTQEELAEKLHVARQSITKWEAGQVYPDIMKLIELRELFHVTVDYLVKEQECITGIKQDKQTDIDELIVFRLEANRNTYVGFADECFSGNFLKEALRATTVEMPCRGPKCYQAGEYTYTAKVTGDINWFQGYEEIHCENMKVYECFFHGGMIK